MSDGKLVFIRPADGTGRLVFNDASEATVPDVSIGVDATFAGETADMPASVQLLWDAGVSRGEAIETRIHWQDAQPTRALAGAHWQDAQIITTRTGTRWQDGQAATARTAAHWQDSQPLNSRTGTRWQDAQAQRHAAAVRWQEAQRLRASVAARWQDGQAQRATLLARWQEAIRLRSVLSTTWQGTGSAEFMRRQLLHSSGAAVRTGLRVSTRWRDAMRPPAGLSVVTQPPVTPLDPCYDPATLGRLEFTEPWANNGNLVFVCIRGDTEQPPASVIVPVQRVYIVINNADLRRVADNVAVPCLSLTLSLDTESWAWGFSASAPLQAEDLLLDGNPVELRAWVNGTEIRLVVDSVERERAFGQVGLRVAGYGRSALLGERYMPQMVFGNSAPRTAHQLMLDALTINGTPLGWAVDWQLTDWTVPAGVFAHTGTYQSALTTIAAAAGGYIRPHASDMSLSVLHRYPLAPWDWATATPAFELPAAVSTREGIRRVRKPTYNRVYVLGEGSTGVMGRVTRAGTAGDMLAQMIVDPLITAEAAARQRGLVPLADVGDQVPISLRLPVLPETGIILPGTLLRYVDGGVSRLGLTRGVNVDVQMPAVYQTLEIESHE